MTDQTVEQALDLVPEAGPEAPPPRLQRFQWLGILRNASELTRTRIGLGMVGVIVLIALLGPLFAPHSPTEFIAAPNHGPTSDALFGADALGRDVFSRFLHGGLTVLWMSTAATLLGVVLGTAVGLIAAYSRNWLDDVLMRINDVFLAFPQIIFVLLAVSALGPKLWLIVLTVGITHAPRVARVMRGAAQQIVERDFVKAEEVAGEKRSRIILEGLLPERDQPAARGARPADDLLDRPDRGDQLSRLRPAAAHCRLGPDDQREPVVDRRHAVGRAAPRARDRRPDRRHEPDH